MTKTVPSTNSYYLTLSCLSENDPCNETIGLGRCPHTAECYEKFRECDGFFDCADGYDETACMILCLLFKCMIVSEVMPNKF